MTIKISKEIYNKLCNWTKAEKPNEAAGYLFKENTIFKKIVTGNHSVVHFIDESPEQLLKWIKQYRSPSAIFHSHPCEAVPSGTDMIYMQTTIPFWGCIWLIMSDSLKLRAWTISFGSCEFTGKKLRFPQRGETVRPLELEVVVI